MHINLGVLHAAMKQPAKADVYFRNAISYGVGNPESYYYYGNFLFEKTIWWCSELFRNYPAHCDFWFRKLWNWEKQFDYAVNFSEISVSTVIFDCWNFPESYNIYVIEYMVIEKFLSPCPASECVEPFDSKTISDWKTFRWFNKVNGDWKTHFFFCKSD